MRPIRSVVFHENTSSKSKFKSKGAELFWAPPILQLNCAYDNHVLIAQQKPYEVKTPKSMTNSAKDLKKAGELEIKKLTNILAQVRDQHSQNNDLAEDLLLEKQ